MNEEHGKFVVSLDFEILWGVRDHFTVETYGENLLGVQRVIPKLLEVFNRHKVNGTFATVGLLFFDTKKELLESLDFRKPQYKNENLSPYVNEVFETGESVETDKYHFASHLIEQIKKYPTQEIATHTFSHYYCLEEGQTIDDFREDIRAAIAVADKKGIVIKSIIFPRNQFNDTYLEVCREFGITSVRGNEQSWIYEARKYQKETSTRRAFRLADSYINISGHHCFSDKYMTLGRPYNIPSSRFLRPFDRKLNWLEWLRMKRITNAMTFAAKHNLTYHIWWHPHNFGICQDENFAFLEKILTHYNKLNQQYNFTSYTMADLSAYLQKKYGN